MESVTRDAYGYAGSNPANAVDPTGLFLDEIVDAVDEAWDNSGGRVVTGVDGYVEDLGDLIERPTRPRTRRQEQTMQVGEFLEENAGVKGRICPFYGCVEASVSITLDVRARVGIGNAVSLGVSPGVVPEGDCQEDEVFLDLPGNLSFSGTRPSDPSHPDRSWDWGPGVGWSPKGFRIGGGAVRWL